MHPRLTLAFVFGAALGTPLAGRSQALRYPRYYVGLSLYSSDYQPFGRTYNRGITVPVQLAGGYQLRPRLAVQASVAYSQASNSYFGVGKYYSGSAAAASPYAYFEYTGTSSQYSSSLALLARYALTRQPARHFQLDVLAGFTVELQQHADVYTRTDSDSTQTVLVTTHDNHRYARNYLLLMAGLSPRYRFSQRLEVFLDYTLSKSMLDTYKVFSSAGALGLRYRFGELR